MQMRPWGRAAGEAVMEPKASTTMGTLVDVARNAASDAV
jgi:hypothetical protein